MGDMGELFNDLKEYGKSKRSSNRIRAIEIFKEKNIHFDIFSEHHLRIGPFDFWPGTGKYWNRTTNKKGRGIFNLIQELETRT